MGRRLARLVATTAAVVILSGCQALPSGSAATTSQCTPDGVQQIADRFINAFDRGDLTQLDSLFAREGKFHAYSTDAPGQRFNPDAFNRDTLVSYFALRHHQHEHLVLDSLDVTYTTSVGAGFWFRVTRSADDGLPPTRYSGKGEIQCMMSPSSITVWAMDPDPWSPIELLPEAAALLLLAIAASAVLVWWRRTGRRERLTSRGGRSSSSRPPG